jgi:hypothetical protein
MKHYFAIVLALVAAKNLFAGDITGTVRAELLGPRSLSHL